MKIVTRDGRAWTAVVARLGGQAPRPAGGGQLLHLRDRELSARARNRRLSAEVARAMARPIPRPYAIPGYLPNEASEPINFSNATREQRNAVPDAQGREPRFATTLTEARKTPNAGTNLAPAGPSQEPT